MKPHAKRKRTHNNKPYQPFPITPSTATGAADGDRISFTGYFTGLVVEILEQQAIASIHASGCFGIGSHTKSSPAVLWTTKNRSESIVDAETLVLMPEEAFFLHQSLRCLQVYDLDNNILDTHGLCAKLVGMKPRFIELYVAYLYLRSKNWVVKCGLKFGGDFLLYKEGPRFYHGSYVVLVRPKTLGTIDMQGHHRIAEASKKEILLIEVTYPNDLTQLSSISDCIDNLHRFTAAEMIPKRFNFDQER